MAASGGGRRGTKRSTVRVLGSPNCFNHDASCGGNVHHAAMSLLGFSQERILFDMAHAKHLVLYGRNPIESIMVKEAKAFMAAAANGLRVTYIDPRASLTATKATRYWQVRTNSDDALNLAILHEVLRREIYDRDVVARYVSGMDTLCAAVADTTPEWQEQRTGEPVNVGPRVVVIGGGNVSIDVALTALREGAQPVDLTSLEKRRSMPASPHEIETAVTEGVQPHTGWGPVQIDEDGQVTLQHCDRTRDDAGQFNPVFDEGRVLKLQADHVILATGQGTDLGLLDGSAVESTQGFILADPKTLMTSEPGVFAGGDAQHGPHPAVEAIRSGKIAAASIDTWLRSAAVQESVGRPERRADVIPLRVEAYDRTFLPPATMPERIVEEVLGEGNDVQIEEGLSDEMAHDEARRSLRCDVCIGCGACSQVCPTGAIHIDDADGIRRTTITSTVVKEQPLLTCSVCGAPTQTPAHHESIRNRLPDHIAALLDPEICPPALATGPTNPWAGPESPASDRVRVCRRARQGDRAAKPRWSPRVLRRREMRALDLGVDRDGDGGDEW